jgi:uncharacterized protein (DUF1800 family)
MGLWRACRALFSTAALMLMLASTPAFAYDEVFGNSFERPSDAPADDAQAARFLGMATFGPTAGEIVHLRAVGYREWIAQQLSLPVTLERPYVEQVDGIPQIQNPGQNDRLAAWLKAAVTAPDQLRQRMAWALSQIMVVTYQQSMLAGDPVALAEYYDTLARDSAGYYDSAGAYHVGTYTKLLYDVTRTPAMGKMLTYRRNKAPDPALGTRPDENYAREVMQLFSIGLVLRNPDFSPIYPGCDPLHDSGCEPIPTYPQATVGAYAEVFTGWSYTSGFNSNPTRGNWSVADYQPMICYDQYHDDVDAKVLLSYTGNYGSGTDAQVLPAHNGCENDLADGIAVIANHPNVAPFISRQLIQRFTTSNPSPAYIARVASVFTDDGHGVYGDLGAVIEAVLLDAEARPGAAPPSLPNLFGKAREPLLKLTALYRYYNAAAADGLYSVTATNFQAYLQVPLGAPSVFNFYLPDYRPPGELGNAGLYGPEFQITNESTAFTVANDLRARAMAYLGNPANSPSTIAVDLRSLAAVATDPGALVAAVDHDLMAGAMSVHMQETLTTMVAALPASDPYGRVTAILQVVLASPEFAIQK